MSVPADTPRVAECYRQHSQDLWAFFYRLCSDPERAWEAVHEAFLRLQGPAAQNVRDERAWLAHVGRNWLRDFARRRQNSEATADSLAGVPAATLDPAGTVAQAELREQVDQALGMLRSDDREILLLRYALNWSSSRMAEVLGIQVAAIDMRLMRARQRMAVALEKLGVNAESVQ
ncbi:MAG TPA: sigma-70 family RNA polymerase sigma factor [Planctomycetaceae bacterium]|nr:sigma-70 family RNA polymerase sigma factor [Planctomycetaceae bacterium]